jgi:DNA-binding CsgD family transcriptional regulator
MVGAPLEVRMSSSRRTRSLTAEERTALSLSATGLLTPQVADIMGVAPDLARAWLTSAITKLEAGSKLEAVLIADRTGQLDAVH